MSATICWKPIVTKEYPSLGVGANSFMNTCERVFGRFPTKISRDDLPKVQTLVDLGHDGFEKVKSLLEDYDSIEVFAEY